MPNMLPYEQAIALVLSGKGWYYAEIVETRTGQKIIVRSHTNGRILATCSASPALLDTDERLEQVRMLAMGAELVRYFPA